jgi:hypothetical protein
MTRGPRRRTYRSLKSAKGLVSRCYATTWQPVLEDMVKRPPCLSFSPSKNLWKCFSCGLGGSNIELVVNVLNYSPVEAVRWLLRDVTGNQRTRRPLSRGKALPQLATSAQSTQSAERNRPDPDVYEALIDLCPLDQSGLSYFLLRSETRICADLWSLCRP